MKDQIQLGRLNVGRQPEGLEELLQFGHYWAFNNLIAQNPDGSDYIFDCNFVFSPAYGAEALDVFPPNYKTTDDKGVWSECFSALVQRVGATGAVVLVQGACSVLAAFTGERPTQAADRQDHLLILAETAAGDVGLLQYRIERDTQGKISFHDGKRIRPEDMQVNFMHTLFTRRDHSERARRYAETMATTYPPSRAA